MNTEEDGWRGFLKICSKCQSLREFDRIMNLFLTHQERNVVATRFLILRELIRGKKTQREMAKDLKVSIAKITRGSNFLKTIKPDPRRLFEDS